MSDGMGDIIKDQERERLYCGYLKALGDFLVNPTDDNRSEVVEAAKKTNEVRGGYWLMDSSLLKDDDENTLTKLKEGDKDSWLDFLSSFKSNQYYFDLFKKLSPFKDRFLILVDYDGMGGVNYYGDLGVFIDSIISAKSFKIRDSDRYVIDMEKPNTDDSNVSWIRCGIVGIDSPRKA